MKKRLISMLMAVLMIASLLPASVVMADNEAAPKCEHKDTKAVIVVQMDVKNKVPRVTAKVCKDCGEVVDVTINSFVASWRECRKCETNKLLVAQKASCGQFGLTVSYCEKCGKAFPVEQLAAKAGQKSAWKAEAPLTHNYDNFTVEQKPTCIKDGWGYVVCKNCGDPKFVENADEAIEYVDRANFSTQAAFEARVREVYAMFAAINPTHNKALFVAVTEEMKLSNGTELKPAKAAAHVATVNGKAYAFDKTEGEYVLVENGMTFDAGYDGDKVCPYCKGECEGAYVKGQPITHTWSVVPGKEGKLPEGNSYGKTDTIKCKNCNYTGANYISSISSWYLDDAVAATCTEDGQNATYCWIDNKGEIQTRAGSTIKATGHHFVPAEGKAVNGHENGYAYVNYEVCTNTGCKETKGDPNKTVIIKAPSATCEFEPYALVPATCNHPGLSISKCPVCGAYEMENGKYVTAPIPKVDKHVASDELANVKAPTCKEEGYSGDVVCKFCGKVMKEGKKIDKVDHTPVDIPEKAPTCTEDGLSKGSKCSVCGEILKAQEVVKASGHKTELQNAVAATCTKDGYSGDEYCTVCKTVIKKGETVKALGHNYVKGVCSRCDAKQPGYNPFSDVKSTDRFYSDIMWAWENGIVEGDNTGMFRADGKLTRAQVVTMLWRMNDKPTAKNAATFTDLTQDWYKAAVAWAVEKGIVNGVGNNKFAPNETCTRAQIVTMLWRLDGEKKVTPTINFTDLTQNWYKDAVAWAANNGITKGDGAGHFYPANDCTRGEAVAFIHRTAMLGK